jgi:hypothetical protein
MNTFDVNHFKVENNKYLFEASLWYSFDYSTSPLPKKTFSQSRAGRVWSENLLTDESVGDFK